jgi:hypothetical protein
MCAITPPFCAVPAVERLERDPKFPSDVPPRPSPPVCITNCVGERHFRFGADGDRDTGFGQRIVGRSEL